MESRKSRKRRRQRQERAGVRCRARGRLSAPRTLRQFLAMSAQSEDRWNRVIHVVAKMRTDGISLREASREYGIDARTVVRLGGSAMRKGSDGRYKAKASDRLLRVLVVLTRQGTQEIPTRDFRQASLIAEHWNAVHKYLQSGDDSALQIFQRKRIIDEKGKRISLMTDLAELDRLGSAGVLSFESLYARSA